MVGADLETAFSSGLTCGRFAKGPADFAELAPNNACPISVASLTGCPERTSSPRDFLSLETLLVTRALSTDGFIEALCLPSLSFPAWKCKGFPSVYFCFEMIAAFWKIFWADSLPSSSPFFNILGRILSSLELPSTA